MWTFVCKGTCPMVETLMTSLADGLYRKKAVYISLLENVWGSCRETSKSKSQIKKKKKVL